jgi:hypothetical protein
VWIPLLVGLVLPVGSHFVFQFYAGAGHGKLSVGVCLLLGSWLLALLFSWLAFRGFIETREARAWERRRAERPPE